MRKKYEQVTSALSYLTKHLYLEYKEFSKLNSKKKKKSNLANKLNKNFTKEDIQMVNANMKKFSTPLAIQFSSVAQSCLTL